MKRADRVNRWYRIEVDVNGDEFKSGCCDKDHTQDTQWIQCCGKNKVSIIHWMLCCFNTYIYWTLYIGW